MKTCFLCESQFDEATEGLEAEIDGEMYDFCSEDCYNEYLEEGHPNDERWDEEDKEYT